MNYLNFKKAKFYIGYVLFVGILLGQNAHAQNNFAEANHSITNTVAQKIIIPYGEKLKLEQVSDAVTWAFVRIDKNVQPVTGIGKTINDYIFSIPGKYEITINENLAHEIGSCEHNHLPSKIELEVSPFKMTFHREEIVFSSELKKGIDTRGITMAVPVTFQAYDHKPILFNNSIVHTAGIGSKISAQMDKPISINEGKQILIFKLNGIASEEAFIMFDFTDINGQVQSYAHLKQIK